MRQNSVLTFSIPNDNLKSLLPSILGVPEFEPIVINVARWIQLFPEKDFVIYKINLTSSVIDCEIFSVRGSKETLLTKENLNGVFSKILFNVVLVREKIGNNKYRLNEKKQSRN